MEDKNYDIYDERYTFIDGHKPFYGDVKRGPFEGYTVILKQPSKSTHIHFENYYEAMDTIENHCDNYDKLVKMDNATAEYLSSEEGAWGRSNT